MRQHDDAVARQVDVGLEGVGTGGQGAAEGGHGVLREGGLVAPVADVLGQPRVAGGGGGGARCRGWGRDWRAGREG